MFRLYFYLLGSLAAGVGVILLANWLIGDPLAASLAGDGTFVALLAIFVWRNAAIPLRSAASVLAAVVAFGATGIGLADLGGALYFSAPPVGRPLVHIFSIGFYPPGADAPFDMGAMLWAFSMVGLCALGLALGAGLRAFQQQE
jgi:hypothetical protein